MPMAFNKASNFKICSYWVPKLMMVVLNMLNKVYARKLFTSTPVQNILAARPLEVFF